MSIMQTKICLCSNVRLNSKQEHTYYFSTPAEQEQFFGGKVVKTLTAYSYVRKSWELKVEGSMEEARTWDYLFFKNTPSGKTWYYFIENIEYVSDTTVKLTLSLDVMQSYHFVYTLLPCFVERQHTETDGIGEHTMPENLETGEYTIQSKSELVDLWGDMCVMIQATKRPGSLNIHFSGDLNGTFSGLGIYAVERAQWGGLVDLLKNMSEDWADIDSIVSMWMYPKKLITLKSGQSWGDANVIHDVIGVKTLPYTGVGGRAEIMDGYDPRNKKLLTYPFVFLQASSNNGNSGIFRYERFGSSQIKFHVEGTVSPEGSVNLVPEDYDGLEYNYNASVGMGGFPTCAWNADVYKIWLAQNQNTQQLAMDNAKITMAASAIGGIASLGMGNVAGAVGAGVGIYHGYNQIKSIMATQQDKAMEPPQARGHHSSSVNFDNNVHTFMFYHKCITKEYARSIDEFFDMYGYQINRVKVPNRTARKRYTYIKTQGCKINSSICSEDAKAIEQIYDKGITFWKNGETICSYPVEGSVATYNTTN